MKANFVSEHIHGDATLMEANHLEQESTQETKAKGLLDRWMRGYRRGSLRFFILHLLLHHSRQKDAENSQGSKPSSYHGYHLAQTIRDITEGRWHPKTASIYPILKELKEEGIIEEVEEKDSSHGSRQYRLTPFGEQVGTKLEQARMEFTRPFIGHGSMTSIVPLLKLASTHMEEDLAKFLENTDKETLEKVLMHIEGALQHFKMLQEQINRKLNS